MNYQAKSLGTMTLLSVLWVTGVRGQEPDCVQFAPQDETPYVLPWPIGTEFQVLRTTTHYTPGNGGVGLYAIDVGMPIRSEVVAARAGVVVAARDSFRDGNGLDLQENFVFIRHGDGTIGRYFHLTHRGALVVVGDTVLPGDTIGLSGNTGQSALPHLHFDVQACGPNLPPGYNTLPCGQTVPVQFANAAAHSCGLVPRRRYRALPFDRDQMSNRVFRHR